jgi:Tfp pilus assembly protein PilN
VALREINLIPAETLHQQHMQRHIWFWSGCFVIVLGFVLGIYLYQAHTILAKKRALMKLKDQHGQLSSKIEEIIQIQEELGKLSEQQAILDSITRNKPYSQVLLRLSEIMNEHTWLTQLTVESGTATETGVSASLKLTGFSRSNRDLGDFLNRLSNEPTFKAIVLHHAKEARETRSKQRKVSRSTLIQFQVGCHV